MTPVITKASLVSMAATMMVMIYSAIGSGASAQDKVSAQANSPILTPGFASLPTDADATFAPQANTAELASMVAAEPQVQALTQDMRCLASAIYFEARSEALDGQLAVGRVIVARTKSGRFPTSYCGVVQQPSQFAFVRHNRLPDVDTNSITWKKAVVVAQLAHEGKLKSAAEGALYFHSVRSKNRWDKRIRVAQIDNHVFYR
ncbi:cell wall hydrolase [Novosphingobium umbonatum]|uniref:Cell wall hydrolase n=2 Tax=Novosphingobium umbonatum TaxID=1908524 RepID=A0A437N579_9SPHN|nr:cell wall hydrolase [Novosphingobium umbonatum]